MTAPDSTIDLFSDTATKPSAGMRRAIAEAEVGDEQRGEDPTVNRLQAAVAELLGKEAALYLPSGIMCNQVAFAAICRAGDEILLDRTAHPLNFEAGGAAALTGAILTPLDGARGIFTAAQVEAAIRPSSRYAPRTRVVSVEQTTNMGGGAIWPLETIREVCGLAHKNGLWAHCDGARLMNAVVETGTRAHATAEHFDSIWIDFSKGLGAPVGAVLAGSQPFIDEAWRYKQRFGGAMRQAGIIAAACLYALDHNVARLAEDHENARVLSERLRAIAGLRLEEVETNIVIFDVGELDLSAAEVAAALAERQVRVSVIGKTKLRAVTHLDVNREQVESAAATIAATLKAVA